MKVLVANIGSTSFKYKLYAMEGEKLLAEGKTERIGQPGGCPDHTAAIEVCLGGLLGDGRPLAKLDDLAAVGFKTVHARNLSGCRIVDEEVLSAMEAYRFLLPAHNPPYLDAMRAFGKVAPQVPRVALFETSFFQGMEERVSTYAVPFAWGEEEGFRRTGFHGASHRWASERLRTLTGRTGLRHISCHLGGSSSLAAIRDGVAVNCSFGMTPQCGLTQNNRCGDVDVFAVLYLMKKRNLDPDAMGKLLSRESGLLGISGVSGDMRDLGRAAAEGNARAKLAIDVFIHDVRRYLGQFMVQLGGLDAISFSGGIGESNPSIRAAILDGLGGFGIQLDVARNEAAKGEAKISPDASAVEVWNLRTNEELIVARAARDTVAGLNR